MAHDAARSEGGTPYSWYDSIELPPLLFQCWFLISPLFQEEAFPIRASIVVTFKILNIEFSHLNVTLNIVIMTARIVVVIVDGTVAFHQGSVYIQKELTAPSLISARLSNKPPSLSYQKKISALDSKSNNSGI